MTTKNVFRAASIALSLGVLPAALATTEPSRVAPLAAATTAPQELRNLDELRAEILQKAIELAERADKIKADVERDQIYRCVLEYDSDNSDARKALGYSKSKGQWVYKKYKEPKNRVSEEDLAAFEAERRKAAEDLEYKLDECFPQSDMQPRHVEALRKELEKLVLMDPANELLEERAGRAWDEQREEWRMKEVVAAKLRRAAVRGFFKESDAALPTGTRTETDVGGEATGIPWSVVLEVPRVLVSSTGEPQEAQRLLEIVHQAGDFLPWAFGVEDPWAQVKIRVYDMADDSLRLQFYSKHPEFKGDAAQTAQAGSSSFGRGCIGVASNDPKGRYDMTATQRVGLFFDNVFHCDLDKGWVRAGLGLYLSHHLCGTRLSLWIQRDEYGQGDGPKLGERLKDPQTDWLEEARIVLRQTSPEMNLVALVGKPAKNFSAEDLVVAHAFGAYLFESRPDDLVEILKRLGKGETPVVVLESELGMTMAGLRERLYDWLAEMRKG